MTFPYLVDDVYANRRDFALQGAGRIRRPGRIYCRVFQTRRTMKLATLKDGSRDGALLVVSRDLKTAHLADDIAPRLQAALDNWSYFAPLLQDLYSALNAGKAPRPFALEPEKLAAPLPRAYQWADASAYVNHVELVRR